MHALQVRHNLSGFIPVTAPLHQVIRPQTICVAHKLDTSSSDGITHHPVIEISKASLCACIAVQHNLHLNVSKTKELIVDFRKKSEGHEPLFLHLVCYFGNGTQQNRDRLDRVRRVAERVTGQDLPSLKHLFEQRVLSKIDKIMADESHPLNEHYTFNRSGIRLRVPRTNKARFRQSFVPNSIHIFNHLARRDHNS